MELEMVKCVPFDGLIQDECSSQLNIRICINMIDMIPKFSDKKAIVT
jgi:hypothetical protein